LGAAVVRPAFHRVGIVCGKRAISRHADEFGFPAGPFGTLFRYADEKHATGGDLIGGIFVFGDYAESRPIELYPIALAIVSLEVNIPAQVRSAFYAHMEAIHRLDIPIADCS
jgi:hypothetical protein